MSALAFGLAWRPVLVASLVLATGLLVALAPASAAAGADDDKKPQEAGKAVGTCVTGAASILVRPAGEKSWRVVGDKETIHSGDLLLGLPGAAVQAQNGAVRLDLLADLNGQSPYPIRENAVVLHDNPEVDLDMTLDRGRANVVNLKESGAAHVRLHVRKEVWNVTLANPGSSLALELYGRWPRGSRFSKQADPKNQPTANLVFLALAGHVAVEHKGFEHRLQAPPGPALMEWDSVAGNDDSPQRLEKLPPWASTKEDTPVAQAKKEALDRFHKALASKPLDDVLEEFLTSEDERDRRLAVICLAATDKLGRLGKALRETKHLDVWDNGVLAMRHWIGRAPGQDQILYQGLIEVSKYKPKHAEAAVQLLHSFGDEDLARPETYQTLIDYLDHDNLAIRGLAHWHLERLVPAGQKIGYNPLDPKEKREAAVQKWRELVPMGQVPERPKAGSDER